MKYYFVIGKLFFLNFVKIVLFYIFYMYKIIIFLGFVEYILIFLILFLENYFFYGICYFFLKIGFLKVNIVYLNI